MSSLLTRGGGRGQTPSPYRCQLRGRVVARLRALQVRIEPVVRRCHVREGIEERDVVLVDTVAQWDVVALQGAGDDAERLVGHVIREATAVREPGQVATKD